MAVWIKDRKDQADWNVERQAQPKGTYMSIFEHVRINKEKKAKEVAELEAMYGEDNAT